MPHQLLYGAQGNALCTGARVCTLPVRRPNDALARRWVSPVAKSVVDESVHHIVPPLLLRVDGWWVVRRASFALAVVRYMCSTFLFS